MAQVTNESKMTRWGAKLDKLNTQIEELIAQRQAILDEIASFTGGNVSSRTVPSQKAKPGDLGDKIVTILTATKEGSDVNTLSDRLKVRPNQVALSLYHLTKKGRVTKQTSGNENRYYTTTTVEEQV